MSGLYPLSDSTWSDLLVGEVIASHCFTHLGGHRAEKAVIKRGGNYGFLDVCECRIHHPDFCMLATEIGELRRKVERSMDWVPAEAMVCYVKKNVRRFRIPDQSPREGVKATYNGVQLLVPPQTIYMRGPRQEAILEAHLDMLVEGEGAFLKKVLFQLPTPMRELIMNSRSPFLRR